MQCSHISFACMLQVYLVRHFSAGESEERIGQLTGILVRAPCACLSASS